MEVKNKTDEIKNVDNSANTDSADISVADLSILAYRSLSPEVSLKESLGFEEQASLVCDTFLDLLGAEIPEDINDKLEASFAYAVEPGATIDRLVLEGPKALSLIDMITELTENGEGTLGDNIPLALMNMASAVAAGLRESPTLPLEDQISANTKLANIRMARLHRFKRNGQGPTADFSSDYIAIVRDQAKWLSGHTAGARAGSLFENYITLLAQYSAWAAELDEDSYIRQSTIREDAPLPRDMGGSGFRFAHDTHIVTAHGQSVKIQSKWGNLAYEAREYDPSVVVISEPADTRLQGNEKLKGAFEAIWKSDKIENMEYCEQLAGLYDIKNIIQNKHTRRQVVDIPRLGSAAIRRRR